MKYNQIDHSLYIHNRKRFTKKLKKGGIAVFNSNDIFVTSADSSLPFVQHRDILHLSGVDQEESILILFPDCQEEKHNISTEHCSLYLRGSTSDNWSGELRTR